ncbi:MAG: circularly permuted type 2 ATP-grasp protein [Methylococcaceae bacterium]|nr:circularly permuted type 2 ATP-grasp protein [Methylococcaceae bacterium]MCI0734547.1 circularly permuted type 2 ATP-grasp protein [Methylococcaceae bacterium]
MSINWNAYSAGNFYDELISSPGNARVCARGLISYLGSLSADEMEMRQQAADIVIREMGVSFTVYSDGENIDRSWPLDIIPRVIALKEWDTVAEGLRQRLKALNLFINDVYNEQQIIQDGIVPAELVLESRNFLKPCRGIGPPHGVWANICGTDLVRDEKGRFFVLEDNLRVPSGVSYMMENREVIKRVFPEMFEHYSIHPVDDYPSRLYEMLASLSPRKKSKPVIVVLTPGVYNSAYFEHSFLAQETGTELVEGCDLFVGDDDFVYVRTIDGAVRVDVIYRRIDDIFMDPEVFRKDSVLGVPGIMRSWKKGKVAIANAPGSGVADDKVIYAFVPEMIRYYLNEDAILPNVPTYLCMNPDERGFVLDHLDKLVVKPANESGGYGIVIGPHASESERRKAARNIRKTPRNFIAQPMLALSTAPTLCERNAEPRHLDLRPFILQGDSIYVTMGGLTRVALKKGSLVVNSSQGGGSKDTWIVERNI